VGFRGAAFAQRDGETGFPHTPHPVGGFPGRSPCAGGWGNPGSPRPRPREGKGAAFAQGMGKPGFPISLTRWVGFRGAAFAQGDGETRFPYTPIRWEGLGGRSLRAGGWGNRVSPYSPPGGRVSGAQPLRRGMGKPGFPIPHPVGGSGRAAPSQEVWSSPHHGAAMLRRVIMQPLCRMRRRSPVRHREEHP